MRKQLQIGEIAQLLGITPKTIRHYQKVGLLAEPERTEAGYRLYTAQDLLRLQRIRRLQALGLSLKQIKTVLGDAKYEHTLREVLQSLDEELSAQLQVLEERRQKIRTLLEENVLDVLHQSPFSSPTFQFVQEQLTEYHTTINPASWEQEAQVYALLDDFQWTKDQSEEMKEMARLFIQQVTEHPEEYQQLLVLGERFMALAAHPEDAPEVKQLAHDFSQYFAKKPFLVELQQQFPQAENPLWQMFSELMTPIYSPSQLYVLKAMTRRNSTGGDK